MKAVVFVDRDGTIIREPRDKQIDSLEKLEFVPGIISGLRMLSQGGLSLVMVSNQDGLGTAKYPKRSFELVQTKVLSTLAGEGVRFEHIAICPHRPEDGCACRKPQTALLTRWLRKNPIREESSFVLGDRTTDVEFARNLGVRAVRLRKVTGARATTADRRISVSAIKGLEAIKGLSARNNTQAFFETANALEACEAILRASRATRTRRTTAETDVVCEVSLSGQGYSKISTGIGFFDHMLSQIARHSGLDIELTTCGDLEIDEHHTVEDTALVLGETIRKALGNKRGIKRYGFVLPMDEARAEAAIDLSGRPRLHFDAEFRRERVGEFSTEMVEHFFRSLADALGASIHLSCRGRNEHHKIEGLFKAFARALKSAVDLETHRLVLPSSKGAL